MGWLKIAANRLAKDTRALYRVFNDYTFRKIRMYWCI